MTPSWIAELNQAGANVGFSVASAGDVNGDGYADAILGANFYDNPESGEGRALVYLGSATGLSTTHAWSVEANQGGADLGFSVAGAGDVNGDGYDDVIVGAPSYDNGQMDEGRAYVYLGSASGLALIPAWTVESNQISALLGSAVASGGDVNGDGFVDVVVGLPMHDNGQTDEGRAMAFAGSPAGPATMLWLAESNSTSAQFGHALAGAGDIDADGYSDVVVGAPFYSNGQSGEGRAYLFRGTATGIAPGAAWTKEINEASAGFGTSVGGAGDIDSDGFDDVVIGAPRAENDDVDEGMAFLYGGSASGLSTNVIWTGESDETGSGYGTSVGTAGDVDGDGIADLIIGAPFHSFPVPGEGAAFLYLGSSGGLPSYPDTSVSLGQANSQYGIAVATCGDTNGDGLADVLIGANFYDNGQTNEGRAFLHRGEGFGGICAGFASVNAYGTSKPGSAGTSALVSIVPPHLGTTCNLTILGGTPGATQVLLFAGFAPATTPFDGGTLRVHPTFMLPLPALSGSGGLTLPVPLPADPALCGFSVYFQAMFVDPAAAGFYHTAQTPGLRWILGT